jgi:hypothetical protein
LWSFGIFVQFWYVVPRKTWQPNRVSIAVTISNAKKQQPTVIGYLEVNAQQAAPKVKKEEKNRL